MLSFIWSSKLITEYTYRPSVSVSSRICKFNVHTKLASILTLVQIHILLSSLGEPSINEYTNDICITRVLDNAFIGLAMLFGFLTYKCFPQVRNIALYTFGFWYNNFVLLQGGRKVCRTFRTRCGYS